jgi:hypothetical protein
VTEDWADRLKNDGAQVVLWRAGVRQGAEGVEVTRELDEFVQSVDLAVVGLAN